MSCCLHYVYLNGWERVICWPIAVKLLYLCCDTQIRVWLHRRMGGSSYLSPSSLSFSQLSEWISPRGLQRDVVYLCWPIAPSYVSQNTGGGGSLRVSANEYSCAHGAQINFGDLTPYLTYDFVSVNWSSVHASSLIMSPLPPLSFILAENPSPPKTTLGVQKYYLRKKGTEAVFHEVTGSTVVEWEKSPS
jgi:hypothetical protein